LEQAGRPLQRWKATFLSWSNSRDPLSHFVVVEFTTIGLMDHLHTSWMTPMFRADFLHGTSKSVEVSPNLHQTTRTPEREARKQFIYNISDFSPGFRAVFPGIEASSFTFQ